VGKYKKRKDGRYATTITLGYKPDGSPDKVFLSAKTEKELKKKILDVQMKQESGALIKESDMPLAEYSKEWFKAYKAAVGVNTKAMYKNIIDHYIVPEIGHLPLNKTRRSDIQTLINDHMEHPRTCEQIQLTINQIFKSAIDDHLITESPVQNIALPKRRKSERRPLTDLEKQAIKAADFLPAERALIMLLFYFGLRRGEALALSKADIDLKKKTLTVRNVVVFDVNTPEIKDCAKTEAGNRTLPIPASVVPFLQNWLKTVNTFYLFPGLNYPVLSKTQYTKMWNRIIKKMNDAVTTDKEKVIGSEPISDLTAHIFRHNYCTMLYYSGVSLKKAVELMGHSDIKMVMEVYAHLDELKEAVQDKLDAAISL